jgi:O-antigen/teichoic acid export membrane protein
VISVKQNLKTGVFWTLLENFGSKLISLVLFAIFARYLSPEDFGVFVIAKVFVDFTAIFINSSFGSVLIQKENITDLDKNTAYWSNIVLGLILFLLFFSLSPLIGNFYDNNDLNQIIRYLSLTLVIYSFDAVQTALLKRDFKYKALALRFLISETIAASISLIFIYLDFGIFVLVIYQLSSALIKVILLYIVSSFKPKLEFSKTSLLSLYKFGLNIIGVRISEYASKRGDDFIVGIFLGASTLGIYTIAYKIMRVSEDLFAKVITKVTFPIFSRLQEDRKEFDNILKKILGLITLIILPVFSLIAFNAEFLIKFLFGEQWGSAVFPMQVLMFVGILQSYGTFFRQILVSLGFPNTVFKISVLSTLALLSSVTIASFYSLNYVIFAVLITNTFSFILYFKTMCSKMGLDVSIIIPIKPLLMILFLVLVLIANAILVNHFIKGTSIIHFIVMNISSLIILVMFSKISSKYFSITNYMKYFNFR